MSGDPYWASVVLLVGANGTDGSTAFVDESAAPHTLTANGAAQVDTALAKFTGSILLDGSGDFISTPDSTDWQFGAGQFTIEAWVRFTAALQNGTIVGQSDVSTQRSFYFWWSTTNQLTAALSSSGSTVTSVIGTWTPTAGTWHHVAVDRDAANKVRVYADGVMKGSATYSSTLFNSPDTLRIGSLGHGAPSFDFKGLLDEVRITKGVARYASDAGYTVPVAAFERGAVVAGRAKAWTGSAWTQKPVRVWSGAAWIEKPLKVWNGTTWT